MNIMKTLFGPVEYSPPHTSIIGDMVNARYAAIIEDTNREIALTREIEQLTEKRRQLRKVLESSVLAMSMLANDPALTSEEREKAMNGSVPNVYLD